MVALRIDITITEQLDHRLRDEARARGVGVNRVVEALLEQSLTDVNGTAGGPARGPSFREVAGDLIGCIEGPEDLSTNKRHLDDLGR